MVYLQPKSEDAFISFTLKETSDNPQQVFNEVVSEEGLDVSESRHGRINGLPAYYGSCTYSDSEGNSLWLRLACIAKDGNVYKFIAAGKPADFNRYARAFDSTIMSFATLTDRQALNRRPMRVKVLKVGQSQTAERFLVRNGVTGELLDEALIINARQRNDRLPGNAMMKLIK